MRISNWKSAKKQAITKLPAFTITAAVIFLVASFIAFWNGHINFTEQTEQLEWMVTDATVNYIYEYYDAFHSHNGGGATLYDVHYEYYVDGQEYTGIIEGLHASKKVGDRFEIKYNPQKPEEHTLTLEPSTSYIISGSVCGILSLSLLGLTGYLLKKKQTLA